jgi:DNA-binding SARP family transcriptional activator
MEFRILGPLEVLEEGRSLPLGGPRQRAVLAVLLLRANEVVSSERLIHELWAEEPPKTADATLRVYVSQLRKVLEPGGSAAGGRQVIESRAGGYLVRLGVDDLDLTRFERLFGQGREALAAGDAATAATTLREALALWRGSALTDFAYETFAQAPIARLEEMRLAALELRVEADLALGRHAELAGELETAVRDHPFRENLCRQLMLALYRSGRQAEALAAYQTARRALSEQLGIDPSVALQELERSILRQERALDLPSASGGPPTPVATPRHSIVVAPLDESHLGDLVAIVEPLGHDPPREIILARLVADEHELVLATAALHDQRANLTARGLTVRAAAFTSGSWGDDLVRLASEQDADLLVVDVPLALVEPDALPAGLDLVLHSAPCDVALLATRDGLPEPAGVDGPVLVPFGGADHDWAAVELASWLAHARGVPLKLLGTEAVPEAGRRDASRLLATASIIVQRTAGVAAEPVLVPLGKEALLQAAEDGGLLVMGLSARWQQEGLGESRLALAREARPRTLLVRRGLRPGGLAPPETYTRYTWTLKGLSRNPSTPGGGSEAGPAASSEAPLLPE